LLQNQENFIKLGTMTKKPIQVQSEKIAGNASYVVGIGVSAGGLEALSLFFENISADTNMAFVIVQHLSEKPKSMLPEILSRKTSLPVSEITGATPLLPGHVYVAPGQRGITLSKNTLNLARRSPKKEEVFLPIDLFFSALAREKKEKAVGIILSGTGKDGTKGLLAIRKRGGTIFAVGSREKMKKNLFAIRNLTKQKGLETIRAQKYEEMNENIKDRSQKLREMNNVLVREIAGRKQLEEDLRERTKKLEEADRRKNEFLAVLSHELRNPLAPIIASVEALKIYDIDDPKIKNLFDIIGRQTEQMTRLLKDLLDVSKILYDKIELTPEYIDIRGVIHNAVEESGFFVAKRNHTLTLTLPPEPKFILIDPFRVQQILANLIFNAAKYTDPGGKIEVDLLSEKDGGDERLRITVKDNGVGIAPSMLPKIFDLFVQAEGVLRRTKGGMGIGLFLIRQLATLHGGTITARSEGVGKGSEFTLLLPIKNNLPPQKKKTPPAAAINDAGISPKRILVVDDNKDAADSLGKLLLALGHKAQNAYSGEEAIRLTKEMPPDIAFIDIAMPEMNGYEVVKKMRMDSSLSRTKLVALTGFGQKEDKEKALRAGFDLHCVKPITLSALKDIIGK
jgi:signal transduction histidine kinase